MLSSTKCAEGRDPIGYQLVGHLPILPTRCSDLVLDPTQETVLEGIVSHW